MIRNISASLFAASVLLLAACTSTPRREAMPVPLKIAAWNLEHLAAADGEGCRPRGEADYAALRAYVERLDADVVAFQEIESVAAAQRVFDAGEYTIEMSNRPDSGRDGFCRRDATSGPRIRKQDVGFAIRKSVRYTRHRDLEALGLGDPDLRWGVDITLDGPRPLRLLALHLKSGCSRGDENEACPILFDQVPVLQDWIAARRAEAAAFVMLGDWNRRLALPDDAVWQRLNEAGPPLTIAGGGRGARCFARYPDFIDHIVLDPVAAAVVAPDSFEEFQYGVPEAENPADHCPVSVRVDRWSAPARND